MAGDKVKVLGINGSARRYGNSFRLLRAALIGAEEEGAETRLIHLYDYELQPCMACYSDEPLECRYPKECPLLAPGTRDDYHALAELILASDAFIVATPVYWFMASAKVKTLFERMTSLENMLYHTGRSLLDGKVAGFIAVGEEAGAAMALSWLMLTANMMGIHIPAWGTAYYHGRGDALDDEQALSDAYNVGINVVRLAKLLKGRSDAYPWYRRLGGGEAEELRRRIRGEAEELMRREEARRPWLRRR